VLQAAALDLSGKHVRVAIGEQVVERARVALRIVGAGRDGLKASKEISVFAQATLTMTM
jgi:hypothetical protein